MDARDETDRRSCPDLATPGTAHDPAAVQARRFTKTCSILGLLWLVLVAGGSLVAVPKFGDFGQYYMGGTLALLGEFDSLYPVPIPGAAFNAGWRKGGTMTPTYAAVATERGVADTHRFIHPPPVALLLAPLGLLSYRASFFAWTALLIACTWATAVWAGRFHERLYGRPTRMAGLIVLLVATSPLAVRSIRTANISPVVALCGAVLVWDLLDGRAARRGALALVVGVLGKYTPVSLLLPVLLLRRWGIAAMTLALGLGVVGLSVLIMGVAPFRTFLTDVAPTLHHGTEAVYVGNQSLASMLQRLRGLSAPDPGSLAAARVAGVAVLAVAVGAVVRSRRQLASPPVLCAAATALTVWWAISGPIFWEHYYLALCPFWPWLLWEARGGGWRRPAAIAAIALTWLPLTLLLWPWFNLLPEPLGSHMFIGGLLMLVLAIARLMQPSGAAGQARSSLQRAAG